MIIAGRNSSRSLTFKKMYWNEINPKRRKVLFEFNDLDSRESKDRSPVQLKKYIFNYIRLFFSSSNIHGFNHLTDRTGHFTEKFIWAIAICVSIYGSVILGSSTWTRYQENPTVISMDREYKEWATALPAFTLCPIIKVDDKKLDELLQKNFTNYSDTEKNNLRTFFILLANATYGTFKNVPMDSVISPKDYLKYIMFLQNDLSYIISTSYEETSEKLKLVSTITELGLCYTYNGEIAPYNSYKYWISRNTSVFPKIEVVSGTPLDGDLFVQITSMNFGYMGFLHSPYEVPDIANRIYFSPMSYYKSLDVTALSIYSTPETRFLNPKQRGCRFLHETNLDISPIYTYNLCRIQCRIDLANKLCKCVPYFYKPLKNYKICDVKGMHCLDQYKDFLLKLRNTTGNDAKVNCGCYPPCDDVNYTLEGENVFTWFYGTSLKWGLTKYPRMRLKRNVLFGFTDVLVSIGGTAGLFFGCSVLSFLEIIYFFTIRLCLISSSRDK